MTQWTVDHIADVEALASLADEWWDLWSRSAAATPFQAPAWLLPWWDSFAPGDLSVVALRQHGRLVALAPLYLETGALGRRLLPIGISLSDYTDVLIDDAAPDIRHVLLACIADHVASWESCELGELAPDADGLRLACPSGCEASDEPASACPVLLLPDSVEGLRRTFSLRKRRSLRMARNRAQRRGAVEIVSGNAANWSAMLDALIRLHRTRWNSRDEPGVLADPRVCRFHRASVPQMMRAHLARFYALSIAGEIAGIYYGFAHRGRAYAYLSGFDPAYAFESPGTILLGHAIEQAVRAGAREVHFLRGQEAYKYGWGAVDRWNRRRVIRRTEPYAEAS